MAKPEQRVAARAERTTALRELGRLVQDAGIKLGCGEPHPPPAPPVQVPPKPPAEPQSDDSAFTEAMRGVRPVAWRHAPLESAPPEPRPLEDDPEDFALLVEAASSDDNLRDHPEYIEGWVGITGKRLLPDLRDGLYSIQDQLDLHGMSRDEARREVEEFVRRMSRFRSCCIKIIHGRGINSRTERAVLKESLQRWLSSRRMARHVVAYASAPAHDGGVGAVYVLLRHVRS